MNGKFLISFCATSMLGAMGPLAATPSTPESILPAGVDSTISINPYTGESRQVRKGTIAAVLNNIAKLNQVMAEEGHAVVNDTIHELSQVIDELVPSVQAIGLFDLFEPILWIGDGSQPGRVLAILLYLKHYPEKWTLDLKEALMNIQEVTTSSYLKAQINEALVACKQKALRE